MNKTKIIVLFLVFGVVGVLIWYFTKNKTSKSRNGETVLPDVVPVSGIPPTAVPVDPNTGLGLAAIERRKGEILASSKAKSIEDEVQASIFILKGVKPSKENYYNSNISRAPIVSAKNVPFNVSDDALSALRAFEGIQTSSGFGTMSNLRSANKELFTQIGTCYVGDNELQSQDQFDKQVGCQGYADCGRRYRNITIKIKEAAKMAGDDQLLISKSWENGVLVFRGKVTNEAIQNLRSIGWKFIGFDS